MPDTVNLGEPVAVGAWFRRFTTDDHARKVPVTLTTLAMTSTDPAGTAVAYAIGGFRVPDTGRYEVDITMATQGMWRFDWTGTGTYTDEQGNNRNYIGKRKSELHVAP